MSASPRILSAFASVLLLGVFLVPAHAQTTRDSGAMAAYEEGIKELEAKNYDAAIAAFGKATQIDQYFGEAFLGRGDALREQEDYSTAITAYNQARDIVQNYKDADKDLKLAEIFNGRGIANREVGLIELALNDFNSAMELNRNNPEVAANLGDLLVNKTQDPANALRVLDKAVELNPEDAKVFRNRSLAHAQLRQFDEAEKDLAKSVELKDDDFETYAMQAQVYLFQDKPEKMPQVIEALSNAIKNYPNREKQESTDPKTYAQGYLLRSEAFLKMAEDKKKSQAERDEFYEKAIADADAVLEESPDTYPLSGQALYRKGVALRMEGKYGEAIKAFTDAIQQLPAGESGGYAAEAYFKRGICWHMQGEDRLARGDFQQAASIDYTDPRPQMWIGYTFAAEKDYRSAIDSFGEAISKNPNFPLPWVNRGLAYIQLREYKQAVDNFNEATRVDPTNPDNHMKRGLVYEIMEENEKAFNAFDLAMQYDDKNPAAFEGAARVVRKLGRTSTAETFEKRAQELKSEKQ